MTRFHPGDVVTVRSDLVLHGLYHMENGAVDSFVSNMGRYAGKQVTIREAGKKYRIEEMGCYWTDEMFEEYFDPQWNVGYPKSDIEALFGA